MNLFDKVQLQMWRDVSHWTTCRQMPVRLLDDWQWAIPDKETQLNPLCEPNP
ncbi:hypothetical protein [Parabacteroides sp.]